MKIEWRTVERIVWLLTIIVGVLLFIRDEAKDRATIENEVAHMREEVKEINKKLERYGEYWMEQKEVNGAVIRALNADIE